MANHSPYPGVRYLIIWRREAGQPTMAPRHTVARRDLERPANGTQTSGWTPDKALLDAVAAYVSAGWSILPLSPAADQVVSGMVPPDVQTAVEWWSDRPYGIACRVGELFDVIELPPQLGAQVLAELHRGARGPASMIEVPYQGRWLALVSAGSPLMMELAGHRCVVRLRRDGWVPLPPTAVVGGRVVWVSRGAFTHSLVAQAAIVNVMRQLARPAAARTD